MKLKYATSERALTRIEVLVLVAVVIILGLMLIPTIHKNRAPATRSQCINNLREVGLEFRMWAIDSMSGYPMFYSTNLSGYKNGTKEYIETGDVFRHFQSLSNGLTSPLALICPVDVRRVASDFDSLRNSNVSYFVGVDSHETYPSSFLAGDRNITNGTLLPNGILQLSSNSAIGWTKNMHNGKGNIGLSDGSVQAVSTSKMREFLANTGLETNRLAMPVE